MGFGCVVLCDVVVFCSFFSDGLDGGKRDEGRHLGHSIASNIMQGHERDGNGRSVLLS